MDKFNDGDLVEARKGEQIVRGRVGVAHGSPRITISEPATGPEIDVLEQGGFTLTLIEAAPPDLPTERGAYVDSDGDVWVLTRRGWACPGYEGATAAHNVPFTRLIPAATVIDRLEALDTEGPRTLCSHTGSQIEKLRAEFVK